MESQADTDYKDRFPPNMLSQMHIYQVLYREKEIEGAEFQGALSYLDTDYVVVKKTYPNMPYLYSQGLTWMAETDTYVILKLEGASG